MSTFGGGYKIFGSASGGQVLGGVQCAFVTYSSNGPAGSGFLGTIYYGPGQTITATTTVAGVVYTFLSGVVFTN